MRAILVLFLFALSAWSAEDLEAVKEVKAEAVVPAPGPGDVAPPVVRDMHVSLRVDTLYSGGGSVSQGFSIPSVRLSLFGDIGKHFDYRFSMGQTREFTSALLPQLLPVEAFLTVNPWDKEDSVAKVKVGMFSPLLNPWWTPDLTDLPFPDYQQSHKGCFMSRDMGVELQLTPLGPNLLMAVGAFNGSGIFTVNTNNASALTAYLQYSHPLGDAWTVSVGAGAFSHQQSNPASVNYISEDLVDVFVWLGETGGWEFAADAFTSTFQDSLRTVTPQGFGAIALIPFTSWLRFLTRMETASANAKAAGIIQSVQLGTVFEMQDNIRAFFLFERLGIEDRFQNTFQARLRWVL